MPLLGGQWRTYQCLTCDWSCRKSPREADSMYKMHMRLKHKTDANVNEVFNTSCNGQGGIKMSKNGNLVYEPLITTATIVSVNESV
jgi:hypothetical protein